MPIACLGPIVRCKRARTPLPLSTDLPLLTMPLTSAQLDQLVEAYANHCVDSMDTKCLEQFVYDTIVDSMASTGESEILERIELIYGAAVLEELVSSATAFPA